MTSHEDEVHGQETRLQALTHLTHQLSLKMRERDSKRIYNDSLTKFKQLSSIIASSSMTYTASRAFVDDIYNNAIASLPGLPLPIAQITATSATSNSFRPYAIRATSSTSSSSSSSTSSSTSPQDASIIDLSPSIVTTSATSISSRPLARSATSATSSFISSHGVGRERVFQSSSCLSLQPVAKNQKTSRGAQSQSTRSKASSSPVSKQRGNEKKRKRDNDDGDFDPNEKAAAKKRGGRKNFGRNNYTE